MMTAIELATRLARLQARGWRIDCITGIAVILTRTWHRRGRNPILALWVNADMFAQGRITVLDFRIV